ncbi:MAG: hypothetical protein [Circular genetic element sp.]|nr:MAG: hypothetical protein [Circular genetic element sp.]
MLSWSLWPPLLAYLKNWFKVSLKEPRPVLSQLPRLQRSAKHPRTIESTRPPSSESQRSTRRRTANGRKADSSLQSSKHIRRRRSDSHVTWNC